MELRPDEAHVERVLEWYEKEPGEALVGEERLEGIGLDDLRALFRPDDDPEMFLPYEVETAEEAAALQPAVRHRIDLGAYAYFVAAYRKDG